MTHRKSRRKFLRATAALGGASLAAIVLPVHAGAGFSDFEAVQNVMQDWTKALARQDFTRWVGYWTEDAVLMAPGHPRIEGHAALEAYAKKDFPPSESFTFSDWRIEGQGDLAVVTNNIEWAGDVLKQVVVLRRVSGEWKIQIVMFNAGVAN